MWHKTLLWLSICVVGLSASTVAPQSPSVSKEELQREVREAARVAVEQQMMDQVQAQHQALSKQHQEQETEARAADRNVQLTLIASLTTLGGTFLTLLFNYLRIRQQHEEVLARFQKLDTSTNGMNKRLEAAAFAAGVQHGRIETDNET